MVLGRPMLFKGPEITISGRTYTFRAAIDRTYGASDVIYLAQGDGLLTYTQVRDGLLQELVPWNSGRAETLRGEFNVRVDHLGWLSTNAREDGARRNRRMGVPKQHMKSLDLWVQHAIGSRWHSEGQHG